MKIIIYFFITIFFYSCETTKNETAKEIYISKTTKTHQLGIYTFQLPENYKVIYKDTLVGKNEGVIMSGNCMKLRFSVDVLGTSQMFDIKPKDYTICTIDSLDNKTRILAYKKGEIPKFIFQIVNLTSLNTDLFGKQNDKNNPLRNHQYIFAINIFGPVNEGTIRDCMTNEELEIFYKAFKNGKIKN